MARVAHSFMEKEVGRDYPREHDQSREFPEELYQKAAAMGWLGLLIPEELGKMMADSLLSGLFARRRQSEPAQSA